jgi:isoquinoline 1-oxidoreductase beta subunit
MTARPVSRRAFLGATGVAGAGLLVGFRLPSRHAPLGDDFAPSGWIHIGPDDQVTLAIDKSEMGEGIMTSMRMVLAEELDADWARIVVGPVPENPAAWSRRMMTGGSTAIRTSYEMLRNAGAAARDMLVTAAAQGWGVPKADCHTEPGVVVHAASARRATYGSVVTAAAALPVPATPPLKDPKTFRLVGTPVKRLDTPLKVNGTAQFGIDVTVPGLLIASVLRCPVLDGKVARYDAAKARAVLGVRQVIELPGIPGTGGGSLPPRTAAGVAVVAETYWQAMTGRRALAVEWDAGPNAALESAGISAKLAQLADGPSVEAKKRGDPASALSAAVRRIDATYEVPYLAHATMEPMNCTAHVRADGCDVWAPTQNQSGAQQVAAKYSGLAPEQVRIHTTFLGGGFGRRAENDFVAEAVQLSKVVGAPVKVIWSREDDIQHDFYRPTSHHRFSAGFDAAGAPAVWTHRIVAPSILSRFGPLRDGIDGTTVEGAANVPYGFTNFLCEQTVADLPIPIGFWRSVGSSHNAFVTESFLDEVAAAAKRDPYQLRHDLLAGSPRHRAVLDLVAQESGWGGPGPAGRARGIALAESFGSIVAEVAEVSISAGKPRVHRVWCAVDCGPIVNPDTIEAQMQSGIVYGLTAALYGAVTWKAGRVEQSNFTDYRMVRMAEMPEVKVRILPSTDSQGGIGEPGTPPIAPALCNAIFALTGKRIRKLPIDTLA